MIQKKDLKPLWKNHLTGIKMILLKSGLSDLKTPDQTSWSTELREFNTLSKLKILVNLPSNGPPRKPFFVMKTWEESESIFWMLPFTPMPSTEEEVKLSQPPEEFTTPLKWPLNLDYKNLSSCVKSPVHKTPWEESIPYSIKEEVSSTKKNKSPEPHLTLLKPTCLSLNHSDSLLL